jgi:hypothetical protein
MWVDRPRIPNTLDVNGLPVPVRESALTRDPSTSAAEQDLLSSNVPTALQAEKDTQAAMEQAHDNLAQKLNPGTMGVTAREAGGAAVDDLVSQEQARAEAQVARMAGIAPERASLQRDLGGGIAGPTATADIGEVASGGIRNIFTRMRQATRSAYNAFAAQPATYNPRYLLDVGNTIREALNNAPGDARVRINPATTPQAQAALDTIDQEIAQLRFTNDAARGNRPITPADMDEVRKQLVAHRAQANMLARQTGNWSDARAVGRVMDEFDKWHQATVQRPGGLLTGNPSDMLASLEAARAAHAAERSRFSRQGPGDVVGTFMERALGKYAGQEMSPEKIAGSILGSPGKAPPENAVPILNHLRDRVFGADSPEWNAIKHGVLSHLTEVPAGAEPLTPLKQAQNIDRFLGNERHANALFDAGEQAKIQQHANNLRSVVDEPAAAGSIAEKIRAGKLTGEQLISQLMGNRGGEVARELHATAPDSIPALKEGIFRKITSKPKGTVEWGPQQIANNIGKFLDKDVAHELFTPNEVTMLRTIQQANKALIPVPGTVNFSRTAPTLMRNLAGYIKQFLSMIAFAAAPAHGLAGHLVGGAIGYGAGHVAEHIAARRAAAQAADLFLGRRAPLPRTGAVVPATTGAIIGHALGPRTRQAPGY